jgi:hypothetical protein
MLRPIGTLPAQCEGCFHDYLSGENITLKSGTLAICKIGAQPLELSILDPQMQPIYATPETYLHRIVLVEGAASMNTSCTIATCKANSGCTVRSTKHIIDRGCWQWYVPGPLHGVELGVCELSQNTVSSYLPFTFNASTARTVTFVVDGQAVRAWVNDSQPAKNNCKAIEAGKVYCPYAKLTVRGSLVVFNPFAA